jgi:hypothetical protein
LTYLYQRFNFTAISRWTREIFKKQKAPTEVEAFHQ